MKISSFLYRVMYHASPLFPDKLYLELQFRHVMGYKLDLEHPKTFQEKLQWLKLHDRKPIYHKMVDKYEAKEYIAKKVGSEYVIPTLGIFSSVDEIDYDKLPNEFVIKTTHDSGTFVICRNKSELDWQNVKKFISKRQKRTNYYHPYKEWPYDGVKPRILVEKFLTDGRQELNDYKFYCFNGKPMIYYITTNKGIGLPTRQDFYDINGSHLEIQDIGYPNNEISIPPVPKCLEEMVRLSEILAQDTYHLRVDFYEINGHVYVGELTFFEGSGYCKFTPEKYNRILGDWIKLPYEKQS